MSEQVAVGFREWTWEIKIRTDENSSKNGMKFKTIYQTGHVFKSKRKEQI